MLAKVITDSGASVVAAQEIGPAQCVDLAAELGPRWSWRKAKAGINAVYWRDDWTLDGEPEDWNLPSYGQMQRTLIVCHLKWVGKPNAVASLPCNQMPAAPSAASPTTRSDIPVAGRTVSRQTLEVGSTHFAAAANDLTKAQANVAKLAQVNYVAGLLAGRTVIVGADLARADDTDDLAYLTGRGWSLNGRTAATPQLSFSLGQITVNKATTIPTGKACDHDAVLTTITV